MRTWIAVAVVAVVFPLLVRPASASDFSEKDVAKAMNTLAEKKSVELQLGAYPELKSVKFSGAGPWDYIIDLRAHLCFAFTPGAVLGVPCQALKKGYPLIAPLITWED